MKPWQTCKALIRLGMNWKAIGLLNGTSEGPEVKVQRGK